MLSSSVSFTKTGNIEFIPEALISANCFLIWVICTWNHHRQAVNLDLHLGFRLSSDFGLEGPAMMHRVKLTQCSVQGPKFKSCLHL